MPLPAACQRSSAAFSEAFHGSPLAWKTRIASNGARPSSVNTASEPPAVSLCTTVTAMPSASSAACTFGVAWAMAASCQSPAASSVKMQHVPVPLVGLRGQGGDDAEQDAADERDHGSQRGADGGSPGDPSSRGGG